VQRKAGLVFWIMVALIVIVLFLIWEYIGFRSDTRFLPPDTTMAGLQVGGRTPEQALNALEVAFSTPIEVTYVGKELSLDPTTVDLNFDLKQTAAHLDAALAPWRGINGFVAYVLRRYPGSMDVPAAVSYSSEGLDSFLGRVAAQYDRPPQAPVPLPENLAFGPGHPGYSLDVSQSRTRLSAALVSATIKQVEMAVRIEQAPPLDINALSQLVSSLVDAHPDLTVGFFTKNLETGQELGLRSGVAFSGLSLLKIAILEETYRVLDPPLSLQTSEWLDSALGTADSNEAANMLLSQVIGQGDAYQGAESLTMSMGQLRLVNTFIAVPYDEPGAGLTISTPANSGQGISTNPTPGMQTTPLDTGLLLEMIYQCSYGGGALMAVYPDAFTTDECSEMLGRMAGNSTETAVLIETGVPAGTKVLHRHGFTSDTHADAGIVSGPGGDFVLVIYVYRPEWLEWEESSRLVANVTTAVYNYFAASAR